MSLQNFKFESHGPLLFWTLMFITAAAIKFAAFSDDTFLFRIAPEASLWAVGILFCLSVSEQTYYRARIIPGNPKRKEVGGGFTVDYEVTIPDEVGFTPKFIYLFVIGVPIWIINLLLEGIAIKKYMGGNPFDPNLIFVTALSCFLSSFIVVIALKALQEVSQ